MDNLERRETRTLLRAGLLVVVGAVVTFGFVYVIGQRQHLFVRTVTYSASFDNVSGLAVESPVWLGGMEVGRVTQLALRQRGDGKHVWVHFEVLAKYRNWVKQDSMASITGRGLLGDKAIDLSPGTADAEVLAPGGELSHTTSTNVDALIQTAGRVLNDAASMTDSLQQVVKEYTQPEVHDDVRQTLRSLRNIIQEVEAGEGVLHALIYEENLGKDTQKLFRHGAQSAEELNRGLAHLSRAAMAMDEWLIASKKAPNSLLSVLVDKDSGQAWSDLSMAAQNIREVTAKVRNGEGTLGGVIHDPTVYEDLKRVLSNLQRNRVLRAMVRYLMTQKEGADNSRDAVGER